MDIEPFNILNVVSYITGFISVAVTALAMYINIVNQKKTLEIIRENSLKNALDSSDIKILGKFLDNTIGEVSIKEYSENKHIQKIINQYIQNVIKFVGSEEQINNQIYVTSIKNNFDNDITISEKISSIIEEYYVGNFWNAFAELRRHIEIVLRSLTVKHRLKVNEHASPNKILSILQFEDIISKSTAEDLRFAISISNKVIHGTEVDQKEIDNAINSAIIALEEIQKITDNKADNLE